ncbi:hypothetical protein CHELA41_50877 [Hyphomicrobiales bacterium]|nr:hypothetical protein CHELA41_50877 [Hyphomicrobiales bacterium]
MTLPCWSCFTNHTCDLYDMKLYMSNGLASRWILLVFAENVAIIQSIKQFYRRR